MKLNLKTTLTCCIWSILVYACDTKKDITVDEIIERSIAALGGIENIQNTKTKTIRGIYFEPGYNLILNSSLKYQRPNSRLMEGRMKDGTFFYEGFDGNTGWEYYTGDSIPRIVSGEAFKAIQRGAEFDISFVNYRATSDSVLLSGRRKIGNRLCYEVDLFRSDGWVKTYYIDTATFLIQAAKKVMPIHAKGPDISILVQYAEYKEVNGVLYPFNITERDISKGGKILNVFMVNEITVNSSINPNIFDHASYP